MQGAAGLLTMATLLLAASAYDTPDYIRPCRRTDPAINECIRDSFNHLRPFLRDGIPELEFPALEPLHIPHLAMENGNGGVRVRAVFTDLDIHGASNYTVTAVKSDVSAYRMDLTLAIPRIEATGRYEVTGNILLFPVRSRGDFHVLFSNITGLAKIYGAEVAINGTKYMKTERLGVDFGLGKSRFRVRDVINDGNVLGEAMNRFLNQHSPEVVMEMKPAASLSISRHFKHFLNNAFLKVPIAVWLTDS